MDTNAGDHVSLFTALGMEETPADQTSGQLPTANIHSEQGATRAASRQGPNR